MWPFDGAKKETESGQAKNVFEKAVDMANVHGMGMKGTFGQASGNWAGREILIQQRPNNIAEISVILQESDVSFGGVDSYIRSNWMNKVESSSAEGYVSVLASEAELEVAFNVIKKAAEIK